MPDLVDVRYNQFVEKDSFSQTWISSLNGWNLYNGRAIMPFEKTCDDKPMSFVQNLIFESTEGYLFSSTYTGLLFYSREDACFEEIPLIYEDSIYTSNIDLFHLDISTSSLYINIDDEIFIVDYKNDFQLEKIFSGTNGNKFFFDIENEEIISCPWIDGSGIEIIKKVEGNYQSTTIEHFLIDSELYSVEFFQALFHENYVFLLSDFGLFRMDRSTEKFERLINTRNLETELRHAQLYQNEIIVTTSDSGIIAYSLFTDSLISNNFYKELNSRLEFNDPSEFKIDEDDVMWISFKDRGVQRIEIFRKGGMNFKIENASNIVKTVPLSETSFLVSERSGKLIVVDFETEKYSSTNFEIAFENKSYLRDAYALNENEVLVISTKELQHYNFRTGTSSLLHRTLRGANYSLNSALNGSVYLSGSQESLLISKTDDSISIEKISDSLDLDIVKYLEFDNKKYYSVNSNDLIFSRDSVLFSVNNVGYVNDIINIDGAVYFLTENGVFEFRGESDDWNIFPLYDEITFPVYGCVKDKLGNVWFATDDGIWIDKVEDSSLLRYPDSYQYDFIVSEPISIKNSLLFGTTQGIVEYDINDLNYLDKVPNLHLSHYITEEDTIYFASENSDIVIDHTVRNCRIYYNTVDPYSTSENDLKYQFWSNQLVQQSTDKGFIDVSNLDYGSYEFTLFAVGSNNKNSRVRSFNITVLPPFHQTWWFRSLAILGLIGIGFFISYLRTRQKLKRQQILIDRQEALQSQRNRMSQDLHDEMGSGLSAIKHLSATQSSRDKDQQIESIATTLIRSMRDLLWSLDESNDTIHNLAVKIRQTANQMLRNSNINHKIAVSLFDNDTSISGPIRRNLVLVTKELFNNALKHSQASILNITVTSESERMILQIEDNGIGYDISKAATGYGLKSIEKRLKDIGATSKVVSNESGTNVKIELPLL